MEMSRSIDVQEFINSHKLSPYQILIIVLCFLIVAVDGFDTAAVGFIAPAIAKQWHLAPKQLAPMFGSGLFGLMVGAFIFGPLADKLGRKIILLVSVGFFGLMCLWSAYAGSFGELVALRFVTGLGLGGAMPTAITMTSEFCPARQRSLLVTIMFCGFTLGGAFGGLAAAGIIAQHGWQGVLILGGVMPIVLVPILAALMPESLRYLVLNNKGSDRVAAALKRLAPGADVDNAGFTIPEVKLQGFPVSHLFRPGLIGGTIYLWVVFFMSLLVYYLLTSWLPTVINNTGIPLGKAALITAMLPIGSTIGAVVIGRLMDKCSPYAVLTGSYTIAALFILLIGNAGSLGMLVFAVFGAGLGTGGSQTGANALAASFYPTSSRATGVSWALGVGRIGSVVGSMIGGVLLSMHLGLPTMFVVIAVPTFLAALSIFGMGKYQAGLKD